jgi:2-dehydro-3-deoxyphosphooctonate aldolase (KDO 8-P synthase)
MKTMKQIVFDDFVMGGGLPLVLIAGPCVIEDEAKTIEVARILKELTVELGVPLIFKASYDKANRTSLNSFRGPGIKEGLKILKMVKEEFGIPVLSDVHRFEEIEEASSVLDVVQVPAFLCRQTDFIMEVARHAGIVNIKKGQFLAPWDVSHIVNKVSSSGNENLMITERGFSFGYNNLVADMRSLPMLRKTGYPVVFDATHSVQLPGGQGGESGGEREMALYLARAAVAVGIDGLFLEVHPNPDCACCDGPNSLYLDSVSGLIAQLKEIDDIIKKGQE